MRRFMKICMLELRKYTGLPFKIFFVFFLLGTVFDNVVAHEFKYELDSVNFGVFSGNFALSLMILYFYLLYLSSIYVSEEFTHGTSKVVFSGLYSRHYMIHTKMVSLMIVALVLALFNIVSGIIFTIWHAETSVVWGDVWLPSLKIIGTYMLTLFCMASFGFLVAVLFLNRTMTLIITFSAFYILGTLVEAALISSDGFIKILLEKIFFYQATEGFDHLQYSLDNALIVLVSSVILYGVGLWILKKRDLY